MPRMRHDGIQGKLPDEHVQCCKHYNMSGHDCKQNLSFLEYFGWTRQRSPAAYTHLPKQRNEALVEIGTLKWPHHQARSWLPHMLWE